MGLGISFWSHGHVLELDRLHIVNILNCTELFTVYEQIVWHANYISIKVLHIKKLINKNKAGVQVRGGT